MKRLVLTGLVIAILTLFTFPLSASADGQTFYVATNGNNTDGSSWANAYTTIAAAIAAAGNNDTIIVGSSGTGHGTGTYTENVDVNKQLIIQSESGYATTTVQASPTDHAFDVSANSVTINGFSVYGATNIGYGGIGLTGTAANCTIQNNRCGWEDTTYENRNGIVLDTSGTGNTITNNICNFNASRNIYVDNSTSNTLSNNTCNSSSYGIRIEGTSTGNIVTGNSCSSNSFYALRLGTGTSGNTAQHNTFDANDGGIQLYNSDSNTIENNAVINNDQQSGFYLNGGSTGNTIQNNNITGNCGAGSYDFYNDQADDITIGSNYWGVSPNMSAIIYDDNDDSGLGLVSYGAPQGSENPVPELPTIILLGMGLVGLGSLRLLQKRRTVCSGV